MPAVCKCYYPGCTFEGNHGFTDGIGGITRFYHGDHATCHVWFSVQIDQAQFARVRQGTVTTHEGKHFLNTPSQSEAFELGVVPGVMREAKIGNDTWIEAFRAQIAGKPRKFARLIKQWHLGLALSYRR